MWCNNLGCNHNHSGYCEMTACTRQEIINPASITVKIPENITGEIWNGPVSIIAVEKDCIPIDWLRMWFTKKASLIGITLMSEIESDWYKENEQNKKNTFQTD